MNKTHIGLMFGCVPVYLDMTDDDCPGVEGLFFGCDFMLDIVEPIFGACIFIMSAINPEYEPAFPIKIIKEL